MAGVRVRGAKRLRRTLKKAGVDLKQMRQVNLEAAKVVEPVAVAGAPVGGPYRRPGRGRPRAGGRLKRSVRASATQRAGVIKVGGYGVKYAGPIHWGWPAKHIRPQTFAADAAKATEPVWVKQYERHVYDVINSVKGA